MSSNTLTSASSVNLNTLSSYYNATLTGNFTTGLAHTLKPASPGASLGDTLVATGTGDSLTGGVGQDSLVALGNNAYLKAGSGVNTLVGSKTGGNTTTLVGNGRSTLEFAGANETFLLSSSLAGGKSMPGGSGFADYKTDSIIKAPGSSASAAASVIQTTLNKFDLGNTLNHGAGVLEITNLGYVGSNSDTLIGNTLSDYILGGTGPNSLVAGVSGKSTLDGHLSYYGSTLVGNGSSTLIGDSEDDLFVLTKAGDTIEEESGIYLGYGATISLTGGLSSYNMAGLSGVKNLVYSGNASATLTGNGTDSSIQGGTGNNFLTSGGGLATLNAGASTGSDTLVSSSNQRNSLIGGKGTNTFYVYNSADTITAGAGSKNSLISSAPYIDLSTVPGNVHFNTLTFAGTGPTTLIGTTLGGTTISAGLATSSTLSDGGGSKDYLIGATTGADLFIVSS